MRRVIDMNLVIVAIPSSLGTVTTIAIEIHGLRSLVDRINAMKGDEQRCLQAGMDGYVSKPVKRQTLFAEIGRVLFP